MIYREREGMEPGEPVLVEVTLEELAAAYRNVLRRKCWACGFSGCKSEWGNAVAGCQNPGKRAGC